ncbi:hypothetical protein DL93DRAFT_2162544 [Clavulina sp. PMI_390]|nr:hypothetical protein DL93DRAFT_2162544 [Clavulina sp. PMI_390]
MDPNIPHDQYHHDHYAQQPQQHHSGAITHQSQMQPPNMEHPYPPAPTQLDYTAGPPLHQEYQEQYQPHPSGTMEHHMVPQPTHLAQHVQPIPHPASGHPGVLSQAQPPPVVRRPSLQNIQTQTGQYYTQPHMPYSPMNPSGYPPPTTGSPATYHAPPGPPHEYATPYGSTQQHAMSPYPAMTPPAANQPYHPAITDGAGHAHTAPGHGGDRSAPVSTPATPSMMHPHAPPQPVRNMSYEHLQHHQQPPAPAQHHVQHPHPGHEHQNVYQHPPPPVSDVQGPYAPAVHQHPHGHLQHAPSYSPNYVQPGTNGHAAPSAPVYESARPPPPPNVESTAPGLPSAPGGLYIETHPQAPQQPIPITPMAPLQTQQQQQQLDLRMSMSATPSPISPATPSEGGHGRPPRSSASSVHSESTESLHSAVSSVSTNAYGPTTPITPSSRGTKGHARRGGRESSTSVTSAAGTGGASGGRHDGGRPTSRASRGSGADDDESDPESELLRAVNADLDYPGNGILSLRPFHHG